MYSAFDRWAYLSHMLTVISMFSPCTQWVFGPLSPVRGAAQIYTTDGAKCLKNKHRTHYMRQLMELIENVPDEHRGMNFCICNMCKQASDLGCTHRQKCLETAKKLLNALAPKWRPVRIQRS